LKAFRIFNKIIIFLLLFNSLNNNAQEDYKFTNNLKFKIISTKDGLSQRSVIQILQDNQGFMWFGTRYGLNKFDGNTFKVYSYNSEDQSSLNHNWVTVLTKDYEGTIWVGTKKGLNKYDKINDGFIKMDSALLSKESNENVIWDIKVQDSSHLWLATNNGLSKFNTKTQNTLKFEHNRNNPNGISSNQIRKLLVTKEGCLWVCTTEKIDMYNQRTNTFMQYEYPNNASPKTTKNNTLNLFQDSKGNIWLCYANGLAIFNKKISAFEDFKFKSNSNNVITSATRSLCEDKRGNIWVGAYDGLYCLNLENENVIKYTHDITNPNSLSQNSIYNVFEDLRGDLWIGTWAGGINYLDKSLNVFNSFYEGPNHTNLNYKVVSSIIEGLNGNLWVGTEGGGVNFYNKEKGTFTYYMNDPNNSNSLSANNVKTIIKDHSGDFWIGTHDEGLNQLILNGSNKQFKRFKNNPSNSTSISDNKITALAEDNDNNIWVGTNEGGLNYYNRDSNRFTRINDNNKSLGKFIYTISNSKVSDLLYVGSQNGLSTIDTKTRDINPINFRKDTENQNIASPVTSIYEESTTSFWIGTEGDGLYNYNTVNKQSIRYGIKNGLPDEVIYGILPYDKNQIWLSTNKGLSRLDLGTKQINNFDETDGIQGDEFNYGAYSKMVNGSLIFGGTNGFTIFNPSQIVEDSFIPPVAITSFNVRNKPYMHITDSLNSLTLDYNQNDFSFNFVALSYSQPTKNQYAYKLEGYDSDWNFIGNNKTAIYTNINPGNYEFKVKASNRDGVWNEKGKTVSIKILPPLWETWWAYILYMLLATGLFMGIRKYTLLRIQDRNELKRERLDKEQMEEVNRLKLQLFTNISHDFRTPLTLIMGPLKKMISEKVGDAPIQKQHVGMYRNANILLQLINQLLDFRKSEAGKLNIHASKNNIVQFLTDVKMSFDELAQHRNITYVFESSESGINLWFDKIEMKKVVLNILSNAFKFTPKNGRIFIRITDDICLINNPLVKGVKIEIQDSGKGIPKEDVPFVFDRFFQLGQQNELRSGTGVGLALAKDIVELHHGEIHVEIKDNQGSCFAVLLPYGNAHLMPEEINEKDNVTNDLIDYYELDHLKSGWILAESEITQVLVDEALPSILIVEDNIEVRQFIKGIFIKDFNVFEAGNGQVGIYSAQSNHIDVIISDVMMPEMDGIEMCTLVKSDIRTSHIPIILLTARTSSKVQKTGYETGADVYLTKPFDASTLKLQVLNILNSRKNLIDKFKKDILLEPKEITVVSTDEVFLKKAMRVIEENLSDSDFNVNMFTEKMNMSQTVLYKKIKVLTGQSISGFVRIIRLKRASQLLSKTDMSIADVAYGIGFNDLKYFRRCFKNTFKETPTAYRKKENV
jgi:signal transduction histidine kinase/ligand-binding sensor domain-containing protein/DNA-binding response OmpR family regulator